MRYDCLIHTRSCRSVRRGIPVLLETPNHSSGWVSTAIRPPAIRQRGYILLMTLLLLAVAGIALAGASRTSLDKALRAKEAQRTLQRRWGILSCHAAFLARAEDLLNQAQEQSGEPVSRVRVRLTLGQQEFEVVVADEQAKMNANWLYEQRGRERTETSVRKLAGLSGDGIRVRLTPTPQPEPQEGQSPEQQLPALGSFAQIFPSATPTQLIGTPHRPEAAASAYVTLWGSGKLNFRRATRPVLKQVCQGLLIDNQIEDLISTRRDTPDLSLNEALNQLALTKEKKDQLEPLLTDQSGCHSLWITVHDGYRSWHRLDVLASTTGSDDQRAAQPYTMAW